MIWAISLYNRLVSLKNNRENAFADIDVQLKLRFDLVENLVNTVKGYATHEKETLQNLTDARTSFLHANGVEGKLEANNQLTGALAAARRFFNSATREYNTSIQSFPSNLIANHFGFTQVEFFELDDEAAKSAPKVQF